MIEFRNFILQENEKYILNSGCIDDVFNYTDYVINKEKFRYINLEDLPELLTKNYYFIIDNYYTIKKDKKYPLGNLFLANKIQLLDYISKTIENDLFENMRFVNIELNEGVFILDDNNSLILFEK